MKLAMLLFVAAFTLQAHASEITKVRVTADSVSVRLEPTLGSKLIDRAMRGTELVFIEKTQGWVGIQSPNHLDYWVYGENVKNSTVISDTLYVRSAPKRLKATHLCAINKGDAVKVREDINGWLKIAAPANCTFWISEKFVEILAPTTVQWEAALTALSLSADVSKAQGTNDNVTGTLRRNKTGLYKLTTKTNGAEQTVCLVSGDEQQMERFLNHAMTVKGKKYWAKDVTPPIIHLDAIELGSGIKG